MQALWPGSFRSPRTRLAAQHSWLPARAFSLRAGQRELGVTNQVAHRRTVFALLVAGVGVGSFIQHGPHPDWQAYAHDLPLAAVLVFVATELRPISLAASCRTGGG